MLIQAPAYATSTDDRAAGFKAVVTAAGFDIVTEQIVSCQEDSARSTAENVLTAHPDLGVFFSVCDMNAMGAAKALMAANNTGVVNVGIDGLPIAAQAILGNQGVTATVAQNPYTEGQLVVQAMADYASGRVVAKRMDSGYELVTSANASNFLNYKH
jgi:ribose transport system substrate-binding protein